jgi:hypothetical protein
MIANYYQRTLLGDIFYPINADFKVGVQHRADNRPLEGVVECQTDKGFATFVHWRLRIGEADVSKLGTRESDLANIWIAE